MKKEARFTKISFVALYFLCAAVGATLAGLTYFRFAYIARGMVGGAALYLFFDHHQYHESYEPLEKLLLHPKEIKDFLMAFITTLVLGWAGMQIVELFLFFLRK